MVNTRESRRFGALLRARREEAGKSLGQLARHLGVSTPYLSDVELDRKPPLVEEKIRSAAVFIGADPEELLRASARSRSHFRFDQPRSPVAQDVFASLQRKAPTMSDDTWERLLQVLKEEK